jgi:hypothetical protein
MLRASSRTVGVPCNESQRRTALVSAAAGSQVERFRQGHRGSGSGACGKEPCRRLGRGSVLGALRKLPQVCRVRTQRDSTNFGLAEFSEVQLSPGPQTLACWRQLRYHYVPTLRRQRATPRPDRWLSYAAIRTRKTHPPRQGGCQRFRDAQVAGGGCS